MRKKLKRSPRRVMPWREIAIGGIVLLFALGALLWALNARHIIGGTWLDILPIVFTVLGVILALCQWLLPFSPHENERKPKVELLESRLDERESPYCQQEHEGIKTIVPETTGRGTTHRRAMSVEHINEKPASFLRQSRYHFPTIDFKFENQGNADTLLTKFVVEVVEAVVDVTPLLCFEVEAEDMALQVSVVNNGWGDAIDCEIFLEEKVLEQVIPAERRRFSGTIKSGTRMLLFTLDKKDIDQDALKKFRKQFVDILAPEELEEEKSRNVPREVRGIMLNHLYAKWKARDEHGETRFGIESIQAQEYVRSRFYVTKYGFIETRTYLLGAYLGSDHTYVTIIEPAQGSQKREYALSRQIPAGGLDRFHIMIAATKSCQLRVCFAFYRGAERVAESENFKIEIWNPRDSDWQSDYQDGDVLERQVSGKTIHDRKEEYYEVRAYRDGPEKREGKNFSRSVYSDRPEADLYFRDAEKHFYSQPEEALQAVNQGLNIDPENATAYNFKGHVLSGLHRDEEALAAYHQASELSPQEAKYHYNQAIVLKYLNKYGDALREADRAVKLDPGSCAMQDLCGDILCFLRKYEEAVECYEQAASGRINEISRHVDKAYFYKKKINLLQKTKSGSEAEKYWEKVKNEVM